MFIILRGAAYVLIGLLLAASAGSAIAAALYPDGNAEDASVQLAFVFLIISCGLMTIIAWINSSNHERLNLTPEDYKKFRAAQSEIVLNDSISKLRNPRRSDYGY